MPVDETALAGIAELTVAGVELGVDDDLFHGATPGARQADPSIGATPGAEAGSSGILLSCRT
jgi:hypothetical protein